eukprot:31522-Pelagococcus_subviridis.AAC.8
MEPNEAAPSVATIVRAHCQLCAYLDAFSRACIRHFTASNGVTQIDSGTPVRNAAAKAVGVVSVPRSPTTSLLECSFPTYITSACGRAAAGRTPRYSERIPPEDA